ncbi:lysylphosphatidylglycerol synthase transmembrane domain-containing protein [Actinomycetaceae bacterium MB13-C1-2]|nr:lysylphosphatidylglycerol synthase transmembrane domain-containing protein [Actinomycetaceae bacterium MB13-C1-2]
MVNQTTTWEKIKAVTGTKTFRALFTIVVVGIVIFILSREIHPSEIATVLKKANVWWIVAAFLVGAISWVGAAVPLDKLAEIKVPMRDATLVQMASSFVGVAAPAGLGPVALHLDYLKKRGMSTVSASAVVAFIALAQVAMSITMVIVALIFDHQFPHVNFPLRTVILVMVGVIVALALTLVIPKVRRLAIAKTQDYWKQIQPQIRYVKQNPIDLAWAMLGVFVQTGTYALALVFCMYGVGHPISFAEGIIMYLVGNSIGSAIPSPGGIGTTLAATVGALTLIGVPAASAASGVLMFRLVTFYLQVPIGAGAFLYMQRQDLL